MTFLKIVLTGTLVFFAGAANAQSVSNRVSGVASGVGGVAGSAGAGIGGVANPFAGLSDYGGASPSGGVLPGGMGVKVGDKTVTIKGAVGVGDDRSTFKAGAGIPF
ncbi:MAG: hypothetical protein K2X60_08875 [Xanthobacteraceae bacterium]|nr:hypothetical protein [Xanthobacteraceae bacterium]